MFSLLTDTDPPAPSKIDKNLYEILFTSYNQRDIEGMEQHIKRCDALDVFRVLQEINRELCTVKLENLVLVDFLEKNDPKMLVGLEVMRRQTAEGRSSIRRSREPVGSPPATQKGGGGGGGGGGAGTESRTLSIAESGIGSVRKTMTEYRLNYRTKAEFAEKLASEVYKRCESLESKGIQQVKVLKGEIEELNYKCADTKETMTIFELHFIKNDTLRNASDRQKEINLRKFVNNWLKNGRALLGTMRLKITSLQDQCNVQQAALVSKADLGGMLGPVDFEQLQIKRHDQNKSLEEKNISLAGLKDVTGRASLALSKEKKVLLAYEQKSKVLTAKTLDIVKGISKLEQEAEAVEKEVNLEEQELKQLKIQTQTYVAPSITDYIKIKQELLLLEKEQKQLHRKTYIQNIKLKNVTMKLRAQSGKGK